MNGDWLNYYDYLDESSNLGFEDDSIFLEWTLIEGSERIKELSRQLRTYLNYKYALIRQRYSKPSEVIRSKAYIKHGNVFLNLLPEFLSLLKEIGADEENLTQRIQSIIQKTIINKHDFEIEILKKIKIIGENIWKQIHILSEIEYYNSTLMKVALMTAKLLCKAGSAFFAHFSYFYDELEKSYEYEISSLLLLDRQKQNKVKSKHLKVKILE